jgi:hypothetical protein
MIIGVTITDRPRCLAFLFYLKEKGVSGLTVLLWENKMSGTIIVRYTKIILKLPKDDFCGQLTPTQGRDL